MKHLGVVGGGQLGRMLTQEAKKLGYFVTVIDPTPSSPAGQLADDQIIADYKDDSAIRKLAEIVDFITFEIELAHAGVLQELEEAGVKVNPAPKTLALIKDKYRQKRFLHNEGIPVAKFTDIYSKEDVLAAAGQMSYPLVLKARQGAYDGRGNAVVRREGDIEEAFHKLASKELYIEQWVEFQKELAVIVARDFSGNTAVYPIVETEHRNNICHAVYAPARISPEVRRGAELLAARVAGNLKGAGVFGIEMFLTQDDEILVNEIAPRVHNSGHLTIEAATTSQFEQQVRAVTGLPLGETSLKVPAAVMINILGESSGPGDPIGLHEALSLPGVTVHIYGKSESRPERKMGHITAIGDNVETAYNKAIKARKVIRI